MTITIEGIHVITMMILMFSLLMILMTMLMMMVILKMVMMVIVSQIFRSPFSKPENNTKYCEKRSITISLGSFMQEEAKMHILRTFASIAIKSGRFFRKSVPRKRIGHGKERLILYNCMKRWLSQCDLVSC